MYFIAWCICKILIYADSAVCLTAKLAERAESLLCDLCKQGYSKPSTFLKQSQCLHTAVPHIFPKGHVPPVVVISVGMWETTTQLPDSHFTLVVLDTCHSLSWATLHPKHTGHEERGRVLQVCCGEVKVTLQNLP